MTTREQATDTLTMLSELGRTALEALAFEALLHAQKNAAATALADADVALDDARAYMNTMFFAGPDIARASEQAFAAAVAVQREALAHYRKEHR